MIDELQRQYLEAMEIPVWVSRTGSAQPAAATSGIRLGPGSGANLFICSGPEASSSQLAADLARALPEPPVWAWPADDDTAMPVAAAVEDHLFSSITIFGEDLAARLFGSQHPECVGCARLVVAPSLTAMAGSPKLRRACWYLLVPAGVVGLA